LLAAVAGEWHGQIGPFSYLYPQTPLMPFLGLPLAIILCCSFGCPVDVQPTGWKLLQLGKATVNYPASWQIAKASRDGQNRVTMTPDSMKQLTMRMVEIFYLATDEKRNFATLKQNFVAIVQPMIGSEGKIGKTEDIVFKGHKGIYAELVNSSLPIKLYAIDGGANLYLFLLTCRRYTQVANPALERDEKAILNSISFDK
jgi:hypothetical protein